MSGVLIITVIAFVFGVLLVVFGSILSKEETNVDDITKHLPGYNCGACGFGSCPGMSEAILKDPNNYLKCKPMKNEKKEEFKKYLKEKGLMK